MSFAAPSFEGGQLTILTGFVLLAATLGGGLASTAGLPRLTGFLLVGILAGPSVLGILPSSAMEELHLIDDFALALIALLAGGELKVGAMRAQARPIVLEPVMKLAVESPGEFQGTVLKTVMQRRGTVIGTTEEDLFCRIEAEVPLAELFGYATDLRSVTQGKAEFTVEFARYAPVPGEISKGLIERFNEKRKGDD
jgi:elongation factor G